MVIDDDVDRVALREAVVDPGARVVDEGDPP